MCPPELMVPGPFTLHANYENNRHYPTFNSYDIMNPTPKFFKCTKPLKSADNPYLPKFLFDGEKNQLLAIENKFSPPRIEKDFEEEFTFTGLTKRLLGSSMRININAFRLFPEIFKQPTAAPNKTPVSLRKSLVINQQSVDAKPQKAINNEVKKVFSWNWESLGCFGITCTKPFAGEANVTLHLKSYLNEMQKKNFEAKILKQEDFLKDLKSLTGIITKIFLKSFIHVFQYFIFSWHTIGYILS